MKEIHHKVIALIVAAGSGQRLMTDIPKQYVKVKQKAILDYTLQALIACKQIDAILCVIASDMHDLYHQSITPHSKILPVVFGGATRQESVRLGLLALETYNPNYVFIHDAARPNIDNTLIENLMDTLNHYDGVCPALPVTDSLRTQDGSVVPRDNLFMVQTPQAFDFKKILTAHHACYTQHKTDFTDDIAIANYHGLKTSFIQGKDENYKITYSYDLEKFRQKQMMLNNFPDIRTATGYDVHRLTSGDGIIMGGIKIKCPYKLVGHSDADVLLHAITDALLGTIAMQDIGYHFNPNDMRWKDAASGQFLQYAHQLLQEKQGFINFIDATIICEYPKISPHRESIRENIATLLHLPLEKISIKATTTEKLGFTGRGEGIAVQAIATVIMNNNHDNN